MRRLIVLVFLALGMTAGAMGMVALASAPAQACGVKAEPRAQQLRATPFIFSGKVTAAEKVGFSRAKTRYTVQVDRVYRGSLQKTVTVLAPSTIRNCGLGKVRTGSSLMFLAEKGQGDELSTTSYLGTSTLNPQLRKNVEEAVGAGNPPEGATPPDSDGTEPVGTRLDSSDPPSIVTAVAPGLGLIAIGILVLLLARLVGRPERP
ncbi:MAG: hypothetical protein L0H93_05350 [Nocardioides sp.]|nr:hypothetical protein [Nocardioides sp.]